jgi:hypothetical protein
MPVCCCHFPFLDILSIRFSFLPSSFFVSDFSFTALSYLALVGSLYPPQAVPDFDQAHFKTSGLKLIQTCWYDSNGDLVLPTRLSDVFKPGTVIKAKVTLGFYKSTRNDLNSPVCIPFSCSSHSRKFHPLPLWFLSADRLPF